MKSSNDNPGVSRRKVLECMTWAGTGVLWTISGGVPRSLGLVDSALAAEPAGLTFLQISDSHVGFDKPANPNALGTLEEAINRIKAIPTKPSFMIHTGDISHLSKAAEFDDAERIISQAKLDVHYVPGEHDFLDEEVKFYKERYGKGTKGAGWYSFDANGVHFIGLVNVVDLKAGGLGNLGAEQLEWLEDDLKGRSKSTPDRRVRPYPAVDGLSAMGLGHRGRRPRAGLPQGVRLGDRAERPHPPGDAEGRGQRHLPHRALDRVPAAGAGHRALARADEGRRRQASHACSASPASTSSLAISGLRSSTRRCRARAPGNRVSLGLMVRDARRRRAPHHERHLLPSPREAAGSRRAKLALGVGGGGLSARAAASVNAALPPTPGPSPPRAMRVEGGELTTSS